MPRKFVKFVLVGVLNTAFSYLLFAFLIFIGLHYLVATTVGTIISILFNFKSTGRLVFGNRDNRPVFRFFAAYGVNYLFGVAGLWAFDQAGVSMYLAGALMLVPAAIVSFLVMRTFVFPASR